MSLESIFDLFPTIDLGDYVLRELDLDKDVDAFYAYVCNENVNAFLSDEDTPKDRAAAIEELKYWRDLFTHKRSFYWAIARKDTNEIIGTCGFNMWSFTHGRAEVSYDLNYEYWGNGITTKALKKMVEFGFERMRLNRIQATVSDANAASIRVLEKVSFKEEGLLKGYGFLKGSFHDFFMYSLLFKDYDKRRKALASIRL